MTGVFSAFRIPGGGLINMAEGLVTTVTGLAIAESEYRYIDNGKKPYEQAYYPER